MDRNGKIHALLATSRVANVPSVICNVWLGMAAALFYGPSAADRTWLIFATLATAGALLYIGGNFFNDWKDRGWDAQHRPERALPRGLFPARAYFLAAVTCAAAGLAQAASVSMASGLVAAAIIVLIVIYTLAHKKSAWAVIPMGLCRALLPVMGCVAFFPYLDRVWPLATALLCYIAGLSLSARHESMAEPPRSIALMARALLLGTAVLVAVAHSRIHLHPLAAVAGALPYLLWTNACLRWWRKPVPRLVSGLLAGIPLVDAMFLLPLGFLTVPIDFGFGVACLAIPPLAFLAALLLQRVAPAT